MGGFDDPAQRDWIGDSYRLPRKFYAMAANGGPKIHFSQQGVAGIYHGQSQAPSRRKCLGYCDWPCGQRRYAADHWNLFERNHHGEDVYTASEAAQIKELPHNTAAHLTVPFPPYASCKFLDLPPVSLRNLQARLAKNSLVS